LPLQDHQHTVSAPRLLGPAGFPRRDSGRSRIRWRRRGRWWQHHEIAHAAV